MTRAPLSDGALAVIFPTSTVSLPQISSSRLRDAQSMSC